MAVKCLLKAAYLQVGQVVYIQDIAATIEAAKSIQKAGREAKEKVRGVEYLVVRIKKGAVYKDPVNTSMQVSITITFNPVTIYKPFNFFAQSLYCLLLSAKQLFQTTSFIYPLFIILHFLFLAQQQPYLIIKKLL